MNRHRQSAAGWVDASVIAPNALSKCVLTHSPPAALVPDEEQETALCRYFHPEVCAEVVGMGGLPAIRLRLLDCRESEVRKNLSIGLTVSQRYRFILNREEAREIVC
ncbi:MAG: hypothetical protein ACFB12_21540 [Leptolyngbyaceae cyanobacterium]